MALKTQSKNIQVHVDPYSFVAEIQVLWGNPVQNYNKDSNEYEPDRAVVPCVLMPYIATEDPEGIMNGEQPITGAEWYEGAPKADGSNRIVDGDDYAVSAEGKPQYSLTVKKNVDYNSPMEIYCVFSITDKRKNTQDKFERSIPFRTTIFDSNNYSLKLNQPKVWTINPLAMQANEAGQWIVSVTAQLYAGKETVPDANAAYWWQVLDGAAWREFTEEEEELMLGGKNADGTWGKTLTLDAQCFRNVSVRARAAYYEGQRPTAPQSDELQATTSVHVRMPTTLRPQFWQTKGIKMNSQMTTPVGFECALYDGKERIGSDKYYLFEVDWYVTSAKPGSTPKLIGSGWTVDFVPASVAEPGYGMSIGVEVRQYAVAEFITSTDGKLLVQDDGKCIIKYKFE